ncbi:MAG: aldose 1-epimerase [Opitutaceae bacterium]
MEKIAYLGRTLARWKVGASTFLAWPEKGARLLNWNLTLGDGSVRDVVYWPPNASLDDIARIRGGNPILFPFAGRTFDQGEIHFWKGPDGVRRPMPMHGVARQGDFELVSSDARGFAARFVPGAEARDSYPFPYEFTVTYRFEPTALSCEFKLVNLGPTPIPWCAGHHFYFTVPWTEGASRSDYAIRIPAGRHTKQDARGRLVSGPALKPEESLANPDLVDTQHFGLRSSDVVFGEKGRPGDVLVRLGTAKVPPPEAAVLTWTESESSPFYCVEPWMGPPNAWETGTGLHWVQPRAAATFAVKVAVV